MQSAEEKIKNMASAAQEHITIGKAKLEEKVEKATARTPEAKEVAHERRKAKEAEAKMDLHLAKAQHAAEKLEAKYSTSHSVVHHPTMAAHHGNTQPDLGDTQDYAFPTYPAGGHPIYPSGGHPPGHKYKYFPTK